ncbi:unnamed protein product [Adineta steineri]|uniref:Uncharacterized protein n=1 Tax=Adineta steineri TaxID=433720 RepID=A0A819UGR4_9BILA|nr:unnamed protein product [Adineta steineri]
MQQLTVKHLLARLSGKSFRLQGRSGRNVAFIITHVLWYALRVYIDVGDENLDMKVFSRTGHGSVKEAKEQIQKFKKEMA